MSSFGVSGMFASGGLSGGFASVEVSEECLVLRVGVPAGRNSGLFSTARGATFTADYGGTDSGEHGARPDCQECDHGYLKQIHVFGSPPPANSSNCRHSGLSAPPTGFVQR